MFNPIKKSYLSYLLSFVTLRSITKKIQLVAYFLLSIMLLNSVNYTEAAQKAQQSSRKKSKNTRRKRRKKNSKVVGKKNKKKSGNSRKRGLRVREQSEEKKGEKSTGASSAPVIPSAYEYINDVIENEYKVSLQKIIDQNELRMGMRKFPLVLHAAFEPVWRKNIEKSLSKFMALLWDENTRRSLGIFIGSPKHEGENVIKKIAGTLQELFNPMVRYMIFLDLLGANADMQRINYQSKQLKALHKQAEVTYELCDLFKTYYVAFYLSATHLASGQIPLTFKEYMELFQAQTVRRFTNSDIIIMIEEQLGGYASNAAKQNPWASAFFRVLIIEIGWVDALYRFKRVIDESKKWWAIMTNFRGNFWYQLSYSPEDLSRYNPRRNATPLGHSPLFIVINSVTSIITGGGYLAFLLTAPLHLTLNFFDEFLPGQVPFWFDQFWRYCKQVYYNVIRLLVVTNELIKLLHGMRDTMTLIKKIKKILEENPQLQRVFVAEYAQIRRFTNLKKTKKFRTLLASVQKVRKTPVTFSFVLKPWNTLPTKLMALYTKILQQPEEVNDLFRAAQFAALKVLYAAVKTKAALLSHGGEAPYPICIANIEQAKQVGKTKKEADTKKPSMRFNDMYTPMLYGSKKKIAKNNIIIGEENKSCIVMGPNASGKSVFLQSAGMNTVTAAGMGIGFASSIYIDVLPQLIIFDANASDNIIAGKSLFQEEAIRYEKLLAIIQQYNLSTFVIFDEKLGSTIPKEAVYLLTAMLTVLDKEKGTTMLISSHFREIYGVFEKMGLDQFKFMSTEYVKGEGFTFKVKDGLSQHPSAVYTLMDMKFHKETFNKFIKMLHQDPTYQFKSKLPGYKKIKQKKRISKTLRFLLYIMLILGLLGLGFLFFRRFKIIVKFEDRKEGDLGRK